MQHCCILLQQYATASNRMQRPCIIMDATTITPSSILFLILFSPFARLPASRPALEQRQFDERGFSPRFSLNFILASLINFFRSVASLKLDELKWIASDKSLQALSRRVSSLAFHRHSPCETLNFQSLKTWTVNHAGPNDADKLYILRRLYINFTIES